ncbi:hypothetical protein B7494_g1652 [Chlorociboria aeruginascens]|nr:hypothetical protein B7494_g1652 [Chlorociboria aeruginascens]
MSSPNSSPRNNHEVAEYDSDDNDQPQQQQGQQNQQLSPVQQQMENSQQQGRGTLRPSALGPRAPGFRPSAVRESRIKDRPEGKPAGDSALKIKIELDLEVEV